MTTLCKMGLSSLVLLALVIVSVHSESCCMPKQWEGVQTNYETADINKPQLLRAVSEIVYDGKNNRLASTSNSTEGKKSAVIRTINFYDQGLQYSIDLEHQICRKEKVGASLPDECVPDQAKYQGSIVLGGGQSTLITETYYMKEEGYGLVADSILVVARGGDGFCYPVEDTVVGTLENKPILATTGYFNVTQGISDPSVFSLPSYCNQVPLSGVAEPGYGFFGLHRQ